MNIHYLRLPEMEQRYTRMFNDEMASISRFSYDGGTVGKAFNSSDFMPLSYILTLQTEQMQDFLKLTSGGDRYLSDGDVIVFPDCLNPQIPILKMHLNLNNIDAKIVAFNHAGRADKMDFLSTNMGSYMDSIEKSWMDCCDLILVGSSFHKQNISDYYKDSKLDSKVYVSGMPFNPIYYLRQVSLPKYKIKNSVIYPHRICSEKGYNDFKYILMNLPPDFSVTVVSGGEIKESIKQEILQSRTGGNVCVLDKLSKKEYLLQLQMSQIYLSTAFQETFGYTLLEAKLYKCEIVVPDSLCYPEFTSTEERYSTIKEAISKISSMHEDNDIYIGEGVMLNASHLNTLDILNKIQSL